MFTTPHLDSHSTTDPTPEIQSAVLTGIEFHVMEEMYAALCMCACAKKTTFVDKDD